MMKRTICGLALALGAAGCARPVTPEDFVGGYEEALCAWSSGCSVFQSPGQCRDALVWDTQGRLPYLLAALEAGRVEFDAEAAEACLEQIAGLPCDEGLLRDVLYAVGTSAAPAACREVFVGKVRNYDPCLHSEECAGDEVVCGFDPLCSDACCAGSCRDLGGAAKLGEACSGACEPGAFCARDPATSAFTTCTERRAAGESCSDVSDSCAEGLFCDPTGEQRVCTKQRVEGASCSFHEACAGGMRCYDPGDGERRCQALPTEGGACSQYNYPTCARADNYCNEENVCARAALPGEDCEARPCMPYAFCRYDDGSRRCVAYAGLDADCGEASGGTGCIGHLQCGVSSRCVEPEAGEVCAPPA